MTISIRVSLDGLDAYDESADLAAGQPTIVDGLSIIWGRTAIVDQPDASTASFTLWQRTGVAGQTSLFDALHVGALVQVWTTDSTSSREVLAWAGEVSTCDISLAGGAMLTANVQCVDPSASLANVTIGDDPWPEESAYDRFQRILSDAGVSIHELKPSGWLWTLAGDMDSTLRDTMVAFRDVDSQPPLDLIQELAETVGGVAWVTADDTGPYIWVEDPTLRKGLRQFFVDGLTDAVTIGEIPLDFAGVNEWPAADVIQQPVKWTADPSQSINMVQLSWQQPNGLNDQGNPAYTDALVSQKDPTSNKGIRSFSVDTQLITRADASALAYRWLTWTHSADWIVSGLSIDAAIVAHSGDADQVGRLMDLLDVRTRIGYRLTVTGLPTFSPSGAEQSYYIEGGTYTWSGGRWQLDLTATSNAIGGSATFRDFSITPDVTFADFDPALRFIDIAGVAGPNGFTVGFGAGPFGSQPFGH